VKRSVFAYEIRGSVPVLVLQGQIDQRVMLELQRHVTTAVADGHRVVVIDLLGVTMIDTPTLSQLCAALRDAGGKTRLAVTAADHRARWVLELCAINGLELYPTINAVIATPDTNHDPATPRWRDLLARAFRGDQISTPKRPE
jgi:anti-anti-sigma regulatory factor